MYRDGRVAQHMPCRSPALFSFPCVLELPPTAGTALDVYVNTANFKAALYEKNIYADAAKTTKIGNALYNIQIFDQSATLAEGNYQSVQVRTYVHGLRRLCRSGPSH